MDYPVSTGKDGVNIKPEKMEVEKLYHCIFKEKIILFYKDPQQVLNCFEVEEPELVEKVKACSNNEDIEKIFEEYVERENLKN